LKTTKRKNPYLSAAVTQPMMPRQPRELLTERIRYAIILLATYGLLPYGEAKRVRKRASKVFW
jgi:hypothetical protein